MKKLRPVFCGCVISAMLMAALALSPGIKELMDAYGVSEGTASLSITLPYLVSIPFTLLAGSLTARYSKKALTLVGMGVICLTGILPYFLADFAVILAVRACMGVGLGLLFTLAPSLAPDYYPEGRLRNATIGLQSAWAGSGGFVFNILSGHLVRQEARNIFLVYLLCVVFFVLVWILLPYQPPRGKTAEKKPARPGMSCVGIAVLTLLFLAANMTVSLSVAVFLDERQIGGAVEAGYATSAYSVAAFAFGCLYVFAEKILGRGAVAAACGVSAVGMLLCVSGGGLAAVYAGSFLIGMGLSLYMPSCVNRIFRTTPPEAASMAVAVMMVGSSVGQTFSSYLINPTAALLGGNVTFRFLVAAAIFALVGAVYVIWDGRSRCVPGF